MAKCKAVDTFTGIEGEGCDAGDARGGEELAAADFAVMRGETDEISEAIGNAVATALEGDDFGAGGDAPDTAVFAGLEAGVGE